jgi:hypothetical protein
MLAESAASKQLSVTLDGEAAFLRADSLAALPNATAVRAAADGLVTVLAGGCQLAFAQGHDLRVVSVHRSAEGGGPADTVVFLEPATIRLSCPPPTILLTHPDGREEVHRPADRVLHWAELASGDVSVGAVLGLLNRPSQDWVNLYRIYELVRANVSSAEFGLDFEE